MSALKELCRIIRTEMNLADDQVYLWDQKIDIPTDNRIYIPVGVASVKPYGNRRSYAVIGGDFSEKQTLWVMSTVDITILGKTADARDRKEEVLLALSSTYSQQRQVEFGFKIATLPTSFVNLSEIDGPAIPYRFTISVALHYKVSKSKPVEYYDSISTPEVTTDP